MNDPLPRPIIKGATVLSTSLRGGEQCLIHKANLRKFLVKKLDFKITYLKYIFYLLFHLMSAIVIQVWH